MKNYFHKAKTLLLFLALGSAACKHDPVPAPVKSAEGNLTANSCHPDTVYFQNQVLSLIINRCGIVNCHSGPNPKNGVLLDNYANIINTGDVKAGNPDDSDIYEMITGSTPGKIMPPYPNAPLNSTEIGLIRTWIQQGAKNNSCVGSSSFDTSVVSFSGTILPIVAQKCQGCHSPVNNPSGYILVTYSGFVAAAITQGALLPAIEHTGSIAMPPYGSPKLSDCEIRKIKIWIAQGGPDN